MADKNTFKEIHRLYYWCNKVLPTVYDDSLSYYELLNKIALKLNALIENYNELPDYIVQEIADQLDGEEIASVLQRVISNFMLNVMYPPTGIPPAVGDGATDDTAAIQGCIEWAAANGGGAVYIPAGWYLTHSLDLKENVSIVGFDRYSTVMTLMGGATSPFVTARGNNTIAGLTLNANSAAQTEYQNAVYTVGEDHLVKDVILDGGKYALESVSGGHLQLTDVLIPSCVNAGLYLHGSAQTQAENVLVETVSLVSGEGAFIINTNNGTYQIGTTAEVSPALVLNGDNNYVQLRNVNGENDYTNAGNANQILVEGKLDNLTASAFAQAAEETETAITNINTRITTEVNTLNQSISAETSARETAVTNLTNTDNTLSGRITQNANDISTLDNRADGHDSDIQRIENTIETLADRYYIFIGDSFGQGWTPDGNTNPYPTLFKNFYSIPNDHWFSSQMAGTGFCAGSTFLTQLTSLYSSIPDRSKITDIYVIGGRNDLPYTTQQIMTAKEQFINYAKVNYPNAKVRIGFVGRSFEFIDETIMAHQFDVLLGYKNNTEYMGALYLNNIEYCLNDMTGCFASDRKHPNQNGQNAILNALVSLHDGGNYDYTKVVYTSLSPSGVTSSSQAPIANISMAQTGDLVKVVINDAFLTVNWTITSLDNVRVEIGTFNNLLCPGVSYHSYMAAGSATLRFSDNKHYLVPITASVRENKLWIMASGINDAHNNYLSGTVNRIELNGLNISYSGARGD